MYSKGFSIVHDSDSFLVNRDMQTVGYFLVT